MFDKSTSCDGTIFLMKNQDVLTRSQPLHRQGTFLPAK